MFLEWRTFLRMQIGKDIRKLEFSGTKIYIMDNIRDVSMDEVMRLQEMLPAWRREKSLAIKNDNVRRESVLSFALLMEALENEYGISDGLDVVYAERGKPLLINYPGLHFNLSHCRDAVACAVGQRNMGVDIERCGRYKERLARHVLNERELQKVMNSDDADMEFTVLWTQKEAYLKMTGTGLGGNMKDVLSGQVQCKIATVDSKNYVCSVAVEENGPV